MQITASIASKLNKLETTVNTNGTSKVISIRPKSNGYGSSINGGELLLLSLATCFCNDIYREAAKRNLNVTEVTVDVDATFGGEGEAGSDFTYQVNVISDAPTEAIEALIIHTDKVAEVHNTLRKGLNVTLKR